MPPNLFGFCGTIGNPWLVQDPSVASISAFFRKSSGWGMCFWVCGRGWGRVIYWKETLGKSWEIMICHTRACLKKFGVQMNILIFLNAWLQALRFWIAEKSNLTWSLSQVCIFQTKPVPFFWCGKWIFPNVGRNLELFNRASTFYRGTERLRCLPKVMQ